MQTLKVDLLYTRIVNYSLHQNHIPIVRKFIITNLTEHAFDDLNIQLAFEPEFASSRQIILQKLDSGETFQPDNVELTLAAAFLSELTERISGLVKVKIESKDQLLFENQYAIDILAFDQWQGLSMLPETLSSFITPNNPNIAEIVKRASYFLNQWTGSPSLDEYQSRNADRVKKQMAAVFEAIREIGVVYCTPPANFEETGQRIRMADTVLSQKLGTCLDMAMLYASSLEAAGIHPIIVFIKGHAFAGGWLIDETFSDIVNDDPALLSKRIAEGINEILLVETTLMNSGTAGSFNDAVKAASYHLAKTEDFLMFIDVKRSRYTGIRPLPQRIRTETGWTFEEDTKTVPPSGPPEEIHAGGKPMTDDGRELTKQLLWERKLLDLSLRNSLLNTRISGRTIQLISVNLSKLEDALSEGSEFQFLAKPEGWDNPLRQGGVYQALNQNDPVIDLVSNDLLQGRLRTYRNENDLAQGLTNLYRASRLSLEENGANTMYLCLGLLKWFETPSSEQPRFAPLILLPVELVRKSARTGYVVRSREEDALINITLLEMLRQDFRIIITGLDPLPRDGSGIDVKVIFNTFREAIMHKKRWDIEEQAILGTFSFNKFIMWNDIHNNAGKLAENKIVASLISGKPEWDVISNQFIDEDLDIKYHPSETAFPLSADSSQIEAICAASSNKSFVLHGPPGTGKSQTITNIIANSLYTGKKVLFVAEKMAALSVVQKRLQDIGLSPFCLELHSNKSKKSYFLEQLKKTSELVRKSSPDDFQSEAERISTVRNELNGYVKALHKKYPSGLSLFDAFSGYASLPGFVPVMNFESGVLEALTREKIIIWTEVAEELGTAGSMCGKPHGHPLTGIRALQYDLRIKSKAQELLDRYASALVALKAAEAEACDIVCISVQVTERLQAEALNKICSILISARDVPSTLLYLDNSDTILNLTIRVSENGLERNKFRNSLLAVFNSDILKLEAGRLKKDWDLSLSKWFLPKAIDQNRIRRSLKRLSLYKKIIKSEVLPVLDEIIEYQKEQGQIDANAEQVSPNLGKRWNNGEAEWVGIERDCKTVLQLKNSLSEVFGDPAGASAARRALAEKMQQSHAAFLEVFGSKLRNYCDCSAECLIIEDQLSKLLTISFKDLDAPGEEYAQNLLKYCSAWRSGLDRLRDWAGWNQKRQKALDQGLSQLVLLYEQDEVNGTDLVNFLKKNIYRNCADHIIRQDSQLSDFNGRLFERQILRFRELNEQFEKLTRAEIFARLASKVPSFNQTVAKSSEPGILLKSISNGGRGTSIRRLFDTIPELLTRMCPCMLMSPISVAQYINLENFKFDLIVFDEASQMPTCEAVGAIARGNNLIVVGDPKQLPPTNFFSTNNIDEENLEKEDLESILDDCLALALPSKHLLWHYRSRHESLITFSNSHYYGNSLMTFPSPDDLTSKVKFIPVSGFYDRGKSRQNKHEATAVIEEITHRLTDPELKKKSIGVVTFSSAQQILIDDMLTEAFRNSPDLEVAADELYEPIFIKNLENVQGDERDIILFSVGYGPDKDNRIYLNFGPLNREGGWRRLNVAVSRARHEMKVFSTIRSDQIDITRSSSEGVAGLKAFLEFAENGKVFLPVIKRNRNGQGSGLADRMAAKLREKGYGVNTNIGCSGFKIDLGITDPDNSSEYILGILFDGQNYEASRTARDREIVQNEVLKGLGWKIHKVWSCDWWDDENKVLDGIQKRLLKR